MDVSMTSRKLNPAPFFNGIMPVIFDWRGAWRRFAIVGGRYDNFPGAPFYGVALRAERVKSDAANVKLPIKDFGIPTQSPEEVSFALMQVFNALFDGEVVYAGCQGGIGRTGVFMALMAKASGEDDPVRYVRSAYLAHAVETDEQEEYIAAFDVTAVKKFIFWRAWRQTFGLSDEPVPGAADETT